MAAWTKEQVEVVNRNKAILARNRFMMEHGEYLGIEYREMQLLPVPVSSFEEALRQ